MTKLKKRRKELKITQKLASELARVNFRVYQHYEQGHNELADAKYSTVASIAKALQCKIDDII